MRTGTILAGMAGLWAVIIAGSVALLLVRDHPAAAPEPPRPPPLSCESVQRRAARCAKQLVPAAGELVETESRRQGRSPFAAGGRRLVAEGYLKGWIQNGQIATYCERYRHRQLPTVRRLHRELQKCWPKRGCEAFVSCLIRVARAELRSGRFAL